MVLNKNENIFISFKEIYFPKPTTWNFKTFKINFRKKKKHFLNSDIEGELVKLKKFLQLTKMLQTF